MATIPTNSPDAKIVLAIQIRSNVVPAVAYPSIGNATAIRIVLMAVTNPKLADNPISTLAIRLTSNAIITNVYRVDGIAITITIAATVPTKSAVNLVIVPNPNLDAKTEDVSRDRIVAMANITATICRTKKIARRPAPITNSNASIRNCVYISK